MKSYIPGNSGLPASLPGHGIDARMRMSAIRKNQKLLLCFTVSAMFFFDTPLPTVIRMIAISIPVLCSTVQKRYTGFFITSDMPTLWITFNPHGPTNHCMSPSNSWICAEIIRNSPIFLSPGVKGLLPLMPARWRTIAITNKSNTTQRRIL